MRIVRTLIAVVLAAILLASTAVRADPVEEKDVISGKAKLDPAKGYILVSGPVRQIGMFLRVPDETTIAAWEKDRQKALDKALRAYKQDHANWQILADNAKANHTAPPPEPPMPTLQTVKVDPPELRDMAAFGPQFVYAKGETVYYLQAVKPGTYVWYGSVMGGNGLPAGGTCMCMGTVRFEVKPGVVTDTGNWFIAAPKWAEDMDVARMTATEAAAKRAAEGKEPRKTFVVDAIRFGLPASLKAWPSAQPEFHASGKLNNFFGIFISRLPPVPDILGYHRDIPVDLRTGQEIESPTLVSRAKIKK
ncbi:hypothetical protein [Novosphingobium sp.]|uniref:hypothetical protein n=1 Tax=Novosphingobium sp. TaxID=1874826 RepID=UPI002620AF0B|nr:hypothetical protein [Novosphingobium sp.]